MARILIADDDELVSEIACNALFASGHTAGSVTNGRDALNIIRTRKPDLVILDCNMPEISGILVLCELRRNVEFYDLPVLILTGRRSDKDVELAYLQGASGYLKKPFDPTELVIRVEELIDSHPRPQWQTRPKASTGFGRSIC